MLKIEESIFLRSKLALCEYYLRFLTFIIEIRNKIVKVITGYECSLKFSSMYDDVDTIKVDVHNY